MTTGTAKISAKCSELSAPARKALLDVGSSAQGAAANRPGTSDEALAELLLAGLIGERHGLTRRGAIARDRLFEALLDEAF